MLKAMLVDDASNICPAVGIHRRRRLSTPWCWLLFLYLILPLAFTQALADAKPASDLNALTLIGHSNVDTLQVDLTPQERTWLHEKGALRLGIAAPDYPPFDMTSNNQYDGLTADYVALLAQSLGVPVRIRRYASLFEVLAALKDGEVDLVGSANSYEAKDPDIVLSAPYSDDQPVLVTRTDNNTPLPAELAGMRIAMLDHYLDRETVEAFYPDAQLQRYSSNLGAISAVAFGAADVFLGDVISANYLVGMNYLNNVRLTDFSAIETGHFAFALRKGDATLLGIVDKALAAVPMSERQNILRRWGAYNMSIPGQSRLSLTEREQAWLEANPRVKVTALGGFRPLTFFNESDQFRGLSADVLAKVTLRTGLKFDVVRANSLAQATADLKAGNVQVIAALTPSTEREQDMRFNRPYFNTAFVLVCRLGNNSPATLDELDGKTLALIRGVYLLEQIAREHPGIRLVFADSATELMDMVARGQADAGVSTLPAARYMISRQYHNRLRITSTVGTEPARFTFATAHGNEELYSILEKALLSLSPEEMTELTNRWRNDVFIDNSYWQRNRTTIIQGFLIAGVLLLLAVAWIFYLRSLISRRTRAERALNDQLEFMRVLIDETPHPIYVRDRQGRMLTCNSGYLEAFGVTREQVMGKSIVEQLYPATGEAEELHVEYEQVMAQGTPHIRDRELTLNDGRRLFIYHWMLPYKSSDGEVIGMISGWIDISERQHLLNMVQDANRAKTTFLTTMSHEIRTPMNAVIGMLEMALKKADEGVLDRVAIEMASDASHGLLELIGDILDIARIESGKLSLAPKRANLLELLRAVARIFEGLAEQKQLRLVLDIDPLADRDVLIDPLRFKQVVSNLLSNAIKFTAQGEVHLTLQVLAHSDDSRLGVRVLVEDSGVGISEDDQKKLFSPFSQASSNTQSARSGSGLGLVICRTLCEMMDGQLQLHSVLGKGTQVEVLLDLALLEPEAEVQAPVGEMAPSTSVLTILVVDDYPANRVLLSKQLGYLGHHVVEAKDGVDALQTWLAQPFDVVITDCNMPRMDGYALARALRAEEALRGDARCSIIGFTANAQPDEKERCLAAGMDDCLFKPITLEELARHLNQATPPSPQPVKQASAADVGSLIDFAYLNKLVHGDTETLHGLLDEVAVSAREDQQKLAAFEPSQGLTSLKDLAHRVKGGAWMIRAHPLLAACEEVEQACAAQDEPRIQRALAALQQEMAALTGALADYGRSA